MRHFFECFFRAFFDGGGNGLFESATVPAKNIETVYSYRIC